LPKSAVVIGGGYIGAELSQIMNLFGVKTTIVARSDLLKFVDRDITNVLKKEITSSGITLLLDTLHTKVERVSSDTLRVHLKDKEGKEFNIDSESVLLAMGRPPNTDSLGLSNTGVQLDEKGFIKTDEFQNTTQQGIYAVGDVTNAPALTPVAIRAGRILSERLFNARKGLKICNENVATVIFSHPPIGVIGMNEADAVRKFGKDAISVHKSGFTNMFYGPATPGTHKPYSLFKLICHKEPQSDGKSVERIVGVHGIGRGIDEIMQGLSIAINMGATKQDFDNSIAIHPTAAEEFVTMDAKYI
jgi:glutathione reductase (NADPH)